MAPASTLTREYPRNALTVSIFAPQQHDRDVWPAHLGIEGRDPAKSVDFLRNLPALWEEAPNSRRAPADSLFESVYVLGLDTIHVEPTPAAVRRGLAEAFRADELVMVGARGFAPE